MFNVNWGSLRKFCWAVSPFKHSLKKNFNWKSEWYICIWQSCIESKKLDFLFFDVKRRYIFADFSPKLNLLLYLTYWRIDKVICEGFLAPKVYLHCIEYPILPRWLSWRWRSGHLQLSPLPSISPKVSNCFILIIFLLHSSL